MFSNTENNSARDSVNTRPRLNAYLNFISWVKNNQQKIAITVGYLLVAGLFFGLGRFSLLSQPPQIRVEEPSVDLTKVYDNLNTAAAQPESPSGVVAGQTTAAKCDGKIKGNISASGKIYHVPGGAFYKRTNPEMCFNTEAEAQAAGFRKSLR